MKKGIAAALVMLLLMGVLALPVQAAEYSDIPPDARYAGEVSAAVELGLMNGVGEGRFDPEGKLSRAMAVTILWRMTGEPGVAAPGPFRDVPDGQWYTDAAAWAAEHKITQGDGAGEIFRPHAPIPREQFAAMAYRWAKDQGYDVSTVGTVERDDWDSISLRDPVNWALSRTLLAGAEGNGIHGPALRWEAAVFLSRFHSAYWAGDGGDETAVAGVRLWEGDKLTDLPRQLRDSLRLTGRWTPPDSGDQTLWYDILVYENEALTLYVMASDKEPDDDGNLVGLWVKAPGYPPRRGLQVGDPAERLVRLYGPDYDTRVLNNVFHLDAETEDGIVTAFGFYGRFWGPEMRMLQTGWTYEEIRNEVKVTAP